MTYVDVQYISVARKNEVEHHEHAMDQLREKIAWLTKCVAWELEQHHSRLKELQQAEDTLAMSDAPMPAQEIQETIEPVSPAPRKRTKAKKSVNRSKSHRSIEELIPELVG